MPSMCFSKGGTVVKYQQDEKNEVSQEQEPCAFDRS
jgi:hypothetical protein